MSDGRGLKTSSDKTRALHRTEMMVDEPSNSSSDISVQPKSLKQAFPLSLIKNIVPFEIPAHIMAFMQIIQAGCHWEYQSKTINFGMGANIAMLAKRCYESRKVMNQPNPVVTVTKKLKNMAMI